MGNFSFSNKLSSAARGKSIIMNNAYDSFRTSYASLILNLSVYTQFIPGIQRCSMYLSLGLLVRFGSANFPWSSMLERNWEMLEALPSLCSRLHLTPWTDRITYRSNVKKSANPVPKEERSSSTISFPPCRIAHPSAQDKINRDFYFIAYFHCRTNVSWKKRRSTKSMKNCRPKC